MGLEIINGNRQQEQQKYTAFSSNSSFSPNSVCCAELTSENSQLLKKGKKKTPHELFISAQINPSACCQRGIKAPTRQAAEEAASTPKVASGSTSLRAAPRPLHPHPHPPVATVPMPAGAPHTLFLSSFQDPAH